MNLHRLASIGFLAILLVLSSLVVLPQPASATTTVRLLPNEDGLGGAQQRFDDVGEGCAVDAIYFDELDEYPSDDATTCRFHDYSNPPAISGEMFIGFDNFAIPTGTTGISVQLFGTGRIVGGVGGNIEFTLLCEGGSGNIFLLSGAAYTEGSTTPQSVCFAEPPPDLPWIQDRLNSMEARIVCNSGLPDFTEDQCSVSSVSVLVVYSGGGGGGLSKPVPPELSKDFIVPSCTGGTITDNRPEAVNGILWIWNFGDGSPVERTTTGNVQHTYLANSGAYTIQVAVQDRSGAIQQFYFTVETGLACLLGQFIGTYLLAALGVLLLVAIAGLTVFSKYVPPRLKVWLKRIFVFGGITFVLLLMFDLQSFR